MNAIKLERKPDPALLQELDVDSWPIWTKEVSTFPWTYDATETCYVLEGEVIVTPDGGAAVHIMAGDLVTFPGGMSCTWNIIVPIRKHYCFE